LVHDGDESSMHPLAELDNAISHLNKELL
jgi:hypothetical protein